VVAAEEEQQKYVTTRLVRETSVIKVQEDLGVNSARRQQKFSLRSPNLRKKKKLRFFMFPI
jgi:hypothetical protein